MIRRLRTRADAGFTLVELLIAVILMGVIIAPLAAVIIIIIRGTDSTMSRFAESADAQLVGAYLPQDLEGIGVRDWAATGRPYKQSIELNVANDAGLYPCGPAGEIAAFRFAIARASLDPTPTEQRVAYVLRSGTGERTLHRLACDEDGALISDVTVARHVDPVVDPVLSCLDAAGATVGCDAFDALNPTLPTTVSVTLALRSPSSATAYTVTFTGQRRQT